MPSRSFKVIGNDAIQLATYDFLLVLHCTYVSILDLRSRNSEHILLGDNILCIH